MGSVDQLREALDKATDQLDSVGSMSSKQSEMLHFALGLLQQLVLSSSHGKAVGGIEQSQQTMPDDVDMDGDQFQATDDDGLQDALDRLCRTAKDKERTVFSAEAEELIEDIELILTSLMDAEASTTFPKDEKGKRKRGSLDDDIQVDAEPNMQNLRDVKRVKGLLSAAHCFGLNSKCKSV